MRLGAALLVLLSPLAEAFAAPRALPYQAGVGLPLSPAVPAAAAFPSALPALSYAPLPALSAALSPVVPKTGLALRLPGPAKDGLVPAGARPLSAEARALRLVAGAARLPAALIEASRGAPELSAARLADPFDGSGGRLPSGAPEAAEGSPRLPPGVERVSVDTVRTASDVDRLIRDNPNSRELIAQLKKAVRRMAPYHIYTYHGRKGVPFAGIDLSARPDLVNDLPEQQSHEVRLIKKIQVWTRDVQVLVREEGKTPDLVVGGTVTELKSLIGSRVNLTYLLDKANHQVLDHAARHGLGAGAVAVDLDQEDSVPVGRVLSELNRWARMPLGAEIEGDYDGPRLTKKEVALSRVYVFAGTDLKVFRRRADGSYALQDPAELPFAPRMPAGPVEAKEVHALQLLAARGRSGQAYEGLRRLEEAALLPELHAPVRQLRAQLDGRRFLDRLRGLVRRGRRGEAASLWREFARNRPEAAARVRPEAKALLAEAGRPRGRGRRGGTAAVSKRLRREGIRSTVVVRGSARAVSHADAQAAYIRTFARLGFDGVRAPAGRRELDEAREVLALALQYEEARRFGELLARDGGPAVALATGGEGGMMEAAARGALSAGGRSVVHHLGRPGAPASGGLAFRHRDPADLKAGLRARAAAYAFFAGGFETAEALFETLGLMRRGRIPRAPIILVGPPGYWQKTLDIERLMREGLLTREGLKLLRFAETAEEAWAMASSALPPPPPSS